MKSSRHAFSLVEILVVLAIVVILAALLLPVFSRVRQNAERTTCASNLKQLASAMQMYLQDSGGAFPLAHTTVKKSGVATSLNWNDRIQSTIPISSLIHCPAFPERIRWSPASADYDLGREVSSDARVGGKGKFNRTAIRFQSQLPDSTTELFTEINVEDNGALVTGRRVKTRCGTQNIFNLHLDGANIAYLDGHVKWMSADAQAQRDEVCGW